MTPQPTTEPVKEPVCDPAYWAGRLETAGQRHHAIFKCPLDRWQRIEARHRVILSLHVKENDSVMDAGCGYGRLLTLLPPTWRGRYWGVDVSPDFVALADKTYPDREFTVADLTHRYKPGRLPPVPEFDWCVLISIRPMLLRNCGVDKWERFRANCKAFAKKLLYLEYDEEDAGTVG